MCGLVGVAGAINNNVRDVFVNMLRLDTMRGPHSTGIMRLTDRGETGILKALGTPWDLAENKKYDAFVSAYNSNILMGHNRYATKGAISKANAHPFECGHIIGAHNGTLRSVTNLEDHKNFEVDSENIYHDMSVNGAAETLPKLNGAFALTWYDSKEESINLVRNVDRPLCFTYTEDRKAFLWASEAWMIRIAAQMAGVKILEVHTLKTQVHMSINIQPGLVNLRKPIEFDAVKLQEVEEYVAPFVTQVGGRGSSNPFHGTPTKKGAGKGNGKKPPSYFLSDFLNQPIPMYIEGADVAKDDTNRPVNFVAATHVDYPSVQLRIYMSTLDERYDNLLSSRNPFIGVPKALCTPKYGDQYLVIDLRTVEESRWESLRIKGDDDDDLDVKYSFVGFQGARLTEDEWFNATKHGCAWCADAVMPEAANSISFVSDSEFLCEDCVNVQEVKEYTNSILQNDNVVMLGDK